MNVYKNYDNSLSSCYIPPHLVQAVLSFRPKCFESTLGLEEHRKRGGISEMTCWLAAVVKTLV